MMSVIHWISARRRLTEVNKTVIMLGGEYSDKDVPIQILAQRDMIKREVKYYEDKAGMFILLSIFGTIISLALYKLSSLFFGAH